MSDSETELNEFGVDCEARVIGALGLVAAKPDQEGFDAIDDAGRRYQIKCRRVSSDGTLYRRIEQVGDLGNFDVLVVCLLEVDGSTLIDAWSIDRIDLEPLIRRTTDGRRWWAELPSIISDNAVVRIRDRLLAHPSFQLGPASAPFRLVVEEPWQRRRGDFGKVKVSEAMATDMLVLCYLEIGRLMGVLRALPNPSPASQAILQRVRRVQKVRDRVRGTMNEQGWDIPASDALEELSKVPEAEGG